MRLNSTATRSSMPRAAEGACLTRRITLALTLHNHQPVGNFGWVIAETFDRAYLPMLEALERHPGVRLGLHYSGPLLAWIRAERPAFIDRLAALVERGQVEIVGGGWYEPVLAALPERDRIGQLVRMADELEALFGRRPRGAWLAERVWEPDLPTVAGDRRLRLDDPRRRPLPGRGDPRGGALGPVHDRRPGPGPDGLRHRAGAPLPDPVRGGRRRHRLSPRPRHRGAATGSGTMGDDGEKFGGWPTTFEHCWGPSGWVERFFERARRRTRDWLTTTTPSGWLDGHGSIGRVYVPTGSYAEMGEWALPADEAVAFSRALHDAVEQRRPEARWLRGAIWRNFQVQATARSTTSTSRCSGRATSSTAMPAGPSRDVALDHLFARPVERLLLARPVRRDLPGRSAGGGAART